MPVFDYQGEKNTQLIKDALTIESINFGAATYADYTYTEENGWKVLDGTTLNYSGCTNPYGAFMAKVFLKPAPNAMLWENMTPMASWSI